MLRKDLTSPAEGGNLTGSDARWVLTRRILASRSFQRSAKLREFLTYVADHAINDHPDQITEQQIGVNVFGRRPDYNPGDDSIVRVQARHLREKLQEYFDGEGASEPITITIPKGSYVPSFAGRRANARSQCRLLTQRWPLTFYRRPVYSRLSSASP